MSRRAEAMFAASNPRTRPIAIVPVRRSGPDSLSASAEQRALHLSRAEDLERLAEKARSKEMRAAYGALSRSWRILAEQLGQTWSDLDSDDDTT